VRSAIRVVTFDLDDTLWAVGPVIAAAEDALWAWLAAHCPRMTERFDRDALQPVRAAVLAEHPGLEHDISALRIRILQHALEQSGYRPRAARRDAAAAFDIFMHARHAVAYFDHAQTVLESLQDEFRLGVISNGNADVVRLEIGKYFAFAISAAGVGASKPAPEVFEAALAAGACAPHEMVHVGDHHEHDIAGAQRLGIHTVWFNRAGRQFPGESPASAEITRLSELPDALARIASRR
jgi:FMN hydrolase / 5-amino-6-(5-phospho-D-ribitylamino)uracil phosphatase